MRNSTRNRLASRAALSLSVALLLLFCLLSNGHATEYGGSMYPGGNEDFMAGAVPPPGLYYLNYFGYYNLDSYRDNSGHKEPIDFEGDVTFNAFRFLYVSKKKLFGADVVGHAIIPVVNLHLSANTPGGHMSQTNTGLGDIEFGPGLAWHWKNFHCAAGIDLFMPTGSFDKEDFANIGRNYWAFQPVFALTYLSDKGFEVSAKAMYTFNTVNVDTHYVSGQEFGADYLIGQHFGSWAVGANGYYYQQMTKDTSHGDSVDHNKGKLLSIGPVVQYNYKNMFFNVKYQWDVDVKNKPEGNKLWFRFMYAF